MVRVPLWVSEPLEQGIADYSTFDRTQDAGFPPDALIDDDWDAAKKARYFGKRTLPIYAAYAIDRGRRERRA